MKRAGDIVRKMPIAAHHALLHRPGIGPDLQHFQIVIRFEQQQIRAAQMEADRIRQIAEIGGDRNLDAFGAEGESDGIGGVVRDGETGDVDIADGETGAGLEQFEVRRAFSSQAMAGAVRRER